MKTKALIVSLLLIIAAFGLFAEEATVKLTGNVYIFNRKHPVLNSGGKEYILFVPRFFRLEEGEEISVEGKILEKKEQREDCPYKDIDAVFFVVEKITIRGITYDLNEFRHHGFGRGGRKGSYGRGRGYGPGSDRGCW
jgi:hypothetical protein